MRSTSRLLTLVGLFTGCNAILGNDEGTFVDSSAGASANSGGESAGGKLGDGKGGSDTSSAGSSEAGSSTQPQAGKSAGGNAAQSGGNAATVGGAGEGGAASGAGGTNHAGTSSGGKGGSTSGGSAGSGGSGVTVADVLGKANTYGDKLQDSYILMPCYAKQSQDCITIASGAACPNPNPALPYEDRGVQGVEYFDVGGIPGQLYLATIHVDGITEAKYYENGTCTGSDTPTTCDTGRAAGLGDPAAAGTNAFQSCSAPDPAHCTDAFYTGGDPRDSQNYNVYKLTVYGYPNGVGNTPGAEAQHYYLNSFPQTATAYETHSTYYVSYSHSIPVVGGGKIEYRTADPNCHAIDNCGPGFIPNDCTATDKTVGRSLPNATVPQMYLGKQVSTINVTNGATQPFHAQILHLTVTAIKAM